MAFSRQTVVVSKLSAYLRNLREQKHVTLETAARETGISLKYLSALEAGDLTKLPGTVYAKNFLKTYVGFIGGDANESMKMFGEWTSQPLLKAKKPSAGSPSVFLTPRRIEWAAIVLVLTALLGYFIYEVRNLTSAPDIQVFAPEDGLEISQKTTAVDGHVGTEVKVRINGEEVFVKPDGAFHEIVDLASGLNTITIQAANKKNKTTEVIRRVLVR